MFEKYTQKKGELCDYVTKWIDIAREIHEDDLARKLEGQLSELQKLRFNIVVLGNIKRGKSTLINTLLGRRDDKLSPIDLKVCTGGIVHYMNTECDDKKRGRECADVYYNSGRVDEDIELSDIGDYIREENNPDNRKGISRVVVYGNFPRLHDCCLVDTPGADAVIEHHHELTFEFLPHADAIIMTTMAGQPLSNGDQTILKEVSKDRSKRIFYLVTQIDFEDEADREEILQHVSKKIVETGLPKPTKLYPVACKKVFDAMKTGQDELAQEMRQRWGVASFEKDLEEFITSNSREGRNIGENMLDTLARIRAVLDAKMTSNEEIIRAQDIDVAQIKKERERINQEFETLRKGVEKKLARFEKEWDRCARRIIDGTDSLALKLEENMHAVIDRAGMISSIKNLFSLNQVLQRAMQEPVADFLDKHAANLQKVIDALGDDVDEELNLYKNRVSELNIASSLGGITLVGAAGWAVSGAITAGIGVAEAASAVTAVAANAALATSTAPVWYSSLPALWGTISGWFTGSTAATAATTAAPVIAGKGALIAAATGAIVPLIIAVAALSLTGPFARLIGNLFVPGKVDRVLQDLKQTLEKQLNEYRNNLIDEIHRQIDEADGKRRAGLDECEERLSHISPETKAAAQKENERFSEIQKVLENNENSLRQNLLSLS